MQHGSYKLTNFLSYDETTEMTSCLVTKYSLSFYVKDSDNEIYLQIMLELDHLIYFSYIHYNKNYTYKI